MLSSSSSATQQQPLAASKQPPPSKQKDDAGDCHHQLPPVDASAVAVERALSKWLADCDDVTTLNNRRRLLAVAQRLLALNGGDGVKCRERTRRLLLQVGGRQLSALALVVGCVLVFFYCLSPVCASFVLVFTIILDIWTQWWSRWWS